MRGSEELEYLIHEEVAAGDEEEAEEEGEEDAVAQYLLGPTDIFPAQHNAHASRRTHAHHRAEGVDDVHERQRDGEARYGHLAHILTQEDAVDDVVYGGDHLSDDRRKREGPQEFAYGFCLKFSYIRHQLTY